MIDRFPTTFLLCHSDSAEQNKNNMVSEPRTMQQGETNHGYEGIPRLIRYGLARNETLCAHLFCRIR